MANQGMEWTNAELDEFEKYFQTNITKKTLYERLHRHNPARSYESMSRKIRKMRDKGGYIKRRDQAYASLRVGYLDIEATHLKADFGFILSWCIKAAGVDRIDYSVITKDEIEKYKFDKRVVRELLETMRDRYDILYAHYGGDWRFDIPYIRTRALINDLDDLLPEHMEKFVRDTWPIARKKLALSRNSLDVIADACGIRDVQKTKVDREMWRLAAHGHQEALKYVLDHNEKDVIILERVHERLKKFETPSFHSV